MSEQCSSELISPSEIRLKIRTIELTVADWARKYGFNRAVVHQSTTGHGSREIRTHLAVVMKRKPSEIWPNRSKKARVLDDRRYNELIGSETDPPTTTIFHTL